MVGLGLVRSSVFPYFCLSAARPGHDCVLFLAGRSLRVSKKWRGLLGRMLAGDGSLSSPSGIALGRHSTFQRKAEGGLGSCVLRLGYGGAIVRVNVVAAR